MNKIIFTEEGISNLLEGIVKRAADDYINACLGRKTDYMKPEDRKHEVEVFFRSDWFRIISNDKIDGEACVSVCRERGRYAQWRVSKGCQKCRRTSCIHNDGGNFTAKKVCEKDK